MRRAFSTFFPIVLATAFSSASAYTVSGTVKDNGNKAVAGAAITLIKENKSTVTDADGKFSIHEDEEPPIGLKQATINPGYISIHSGILSFSQSGNSPVKVQIFDLMGNQVEKRKEFIQTHSKDVRFLDI